MYLFRSEGSHCLNLLDSVFGIQALNSGLVISELVQGCTGHCLDLLNSSIGIRALHAGLVNSSGSKVYVNQMDKYDPAERSNGRL